MKNNVKKNGTIRLDWDEWTYFLNSTLTHRRGAQWLYGPIAACSVFGVPMTSALFARIIDVRRRDLEHAISDWKIAGHPEPIRYTERSGHMRPKHAVVAELFFLFHAERNNQKYEVGPVITDTMKDTLSCMNEKELEAFLQILVVDKNTLKYGNWDRFSGIDHWGLLDRILELHEDEDITLSKEALARTLLGLIWAIPPKRNDTEKQYTLESLSQYAPPMYDDRIMAKLYTEWGKLLAGMKQDTSAEEKLRAVVKCSDKDIHSRTELGRLLARQHGREAEAERFLKEAIHIDPKNLHPHTELGRLLARQPGREAEAERFLKDTIQISSKDIQSRTELGRLLAKQPGREAEAERFLKDAIQINSKDIQSRTELGRLLAKQPGREADAERFLSEAIRIDPENIHPHTELGRLLARQAGREADAERYLRKAFSIDRRQLHPRIVLADLCVRQNRRDEAEQLYRDVLKLDRKNRFALNGLKKLGKQP